MVTFGKEKIYKETRLEMSFFKETRLWSWGPSQSGFDYI